jgi:hypothetical protein
MGHNQPTVTEVSLTSQVSEAGADSAALSRRIEMHPCRRERKSNTNRLLDRPTRGSIRLRGEETATLEEDAVAELRLAQLGFVFQFHFLLPEFSALENVKLPKQLSGEAAGRESPARWRMILADKPTGNLDSAASANVQRILEDLAHRFGRAVIVVTHDREFCRGHRPGDRHIRWKDRAGYVMLLRTRQVQTLSAGAIVSLVPVFLVVDVVVEFQALDDVVAVAQADIGMRLLLVRQRHGLAANVDSADRPKAVGQCALIRRFSAGPHPAERSARTRELNVHSAGLRLGGADSHEPSIVRRRGGDLRDQRYGGNEQDRAHLVSPLDVNRTLHRRRPSKRASVRKRFDVNQDDESSCC